MFHRFNKYLFYSLHFLLLLTSMHVQAQREPKFIDGYAPSFWYDTRDLILFPRSFQKNDWWVAAMAASLTGTALLVDEGVEAALRKSDIRKRDYPWVQYTITNWGSGINTGSVTAALFTIGSVRHDDRLRWIALLQAKTLGISALGTGFTKLVFQRHRPDASMDPPEAWNWEGPFKGFSGNYSFVSNHSYSAFAWATVTAKSVDRKLLRVALYSMAGCVSMSRVISGHHWAGDAVAGSALGYLTGSLLYRLQEKNWKKKPLGQRNFKQ